MTFVSGKQSVGERDAQEDAFRIVRQSEQDPNSDILMLLSDGMGGHVGGEVASNLALDEFERHFTSVSKNPKPRSRLKEALLASNEAIGARVAEEEKLKGMGCTVLGALKLGDKLLWISVGDSVLFLLRQGRLKRLSADHSLYGELLEMVRDGKMTQADADAHPRRNALRSAVVGEPISLIDLNSITLEPDDILILASDGLETLSDAQIASVLKKNLKADVRNISSDLLNAVDAKARPRQDNTTVVVYRHEREGMSGFFNDSRWKLGQNGGGLGKKNILAGLIGFCAAFVLGVLIYLIGFAGPEPEPVIVEPAVDAVDRSETAISGDDEIDDGSGDAETTLSPDGITGDETETGSGGDVQDSIDNGQGSQGDQSDLENEDPALENPDVDSDAPTEGESPSSPAGDEPDSGEASSPEGGGTTTAPEDD